MPLSGGGSLHLSLNGSGFRLAYDTEGGVFHRVLRVGDCRGLERCESVARVQSCGIILASLSEKEIFMCPHAQAPRQKLGMHGGLPVENANAERRIR